jgi:hypothetical protein
MPKVKFRDDYHHTWPSRAMSSYPAGWEGSVKQEVADAATAAGKLVGSRAPTDGDELPRNVPKLKKIARDEGIDVGTATSADDLKAAITAERTARATPPSPTSATPGAPAAPITSAPPLSNEGVSE